MRHLTTSLLFSSLLALGYSSSALADAAPAEPKAKSPAAKHAKSPAAPHAKGPEGAACDVAQVGILHEGDQRAAPWNLTKHLAKNFTDRKVAWLMKESTYQSFVIKTAAKNFGRCNDTGCYLFAAPSTVIQKAVKDSLKDGKHDAAVIGKALGLPAANFEGPLRLMTLDTKTVPVCLRLPVDSDPGVWKCQTPEDKDCFKFGGYTSGGVPELMVLNAPVDKTQVELIP